MSRLCRRTPNFITGHVVEHERLLSHVGTASLSTGRSTQHLELNTVSTHADWVNQGERFGDTHLGWLLGG